MTLAEEHRRLVERVAALEQARGELQITLNGADGSAMTTTVAAAVAMLHAALDLSTQDRADLRAMVEKLQPVVEKLEGGYDDMKAALDTLRQDSAAGSVDRADMRTSMHLVIGAWDKQRKDQEAIRKRREQQEERDRQEREEQATRLRWLITWGLGAVAAIGISTLMVEIGTVIEHSGGLTMQAAWALVGVAVAFLVGAGLWVRYGWGLKPGAAHPPHIVHPPHTNHHQGGQGP